MPIQIKEGAKIVRETRLTAIRVLGTLHSRYVEKTADQVKAILRAKGADYAESDLVIGALRPGAKLGAACPTKLYKLVQKGDLTMKQFLSVVSVKKDPLKKILGDDAVDKISEEIADPTPSLITEFKEGVQFDPKNIEQLIESIVPNAIVAGA
jgi:hypothetical protein